MNGWRDRVAPEKPDYPPGLPSISALRAVREDALDDRTRKLIEEIIEDCTDESLRSLSAVLKEYHTKRMLQRLAERKEEEKRIAQLPPENRWVPSDIKGYSSGPWTFRAGNLFRPCAIAFIQELSGKIREISTTAEAGTLYETGAGEMLQKLNAKYEGEFERERPFLSDGRTRDLPPYWASERPGLERKIRIERNKFEAANPDQLADEVSQTNEHKTLGRRVGQPRIERWFREVRCPQFEGKTPPNSTECFYAAQEYFAPDRAVRELVRKARKIAAPGHWQKTGPHRQPD